MEVGSGTTVDAGTIRPTRIGDGTKIDNLVMVAHNVVVGRHCLLCGQSAIAGSSVVGDRVVMGGRAGVGDNLTIGDDVVLTAKSATSHNVPAGKVISGIPAFDNREWLRATAAFRRLGEMQRALRLLEERLRALEEKNS